MFTAPETRNSTVGDSSTVWMEREDKGNTPIRCTVWILSGMDHTAPEPRHETIHNNQLKDTKVLGTYQQVT